MKAGRDLNAIAVYSPVISKASDLFACIRPGSRLVW